jgi:O-glycosyl hydrolase
VVVAGRHAAVVALVGLLGAAGASSRAVATAAPVRATLSGAGDVVRVDLAARHQVMQGFGSTVRVWSDPHLSNNPQTVVPPAAQAEILKAIYRRLGLTRSRQYLDQQITPGPAGPYNFSAKLGADQVAYVKQAKAYGLATFFPAPVYLEDWMKADDPAGYVAYAMTILRYWRAQGVQVPFFSPVNEPQVSHNFPPQWMHDVVLLLGRQLRTAGFETKLVIPDDENPIDAYRRADAVLSDPAARQYVGAVAYHIYRIGGPSDWERLKALAARYRLPVWMTEYWSADYGTWQGALNWAQTMNDLITTGGVSAVDYLWGFFGDWLPPGGSLVSIAFDHGVYRSLSYTPLYWAVGQYSRFVRPGYVRVDTSSSRSGAVVSAYTFRERLVIVAINRGSGPARTRFIVTSRQLSRITAIRSSRAEAWATLPAIRAVGSGFAAILAPQSITTFVTQTR